MQVAAMQHQQQNSVYSGSNTPRISTQQQQQPPQQVPTGNVKKWKNKLKTFLNSPLPGASSSSSSSTNNNNISNNGNAAASSAISSSLSAASSSSATPRPESQSPNDTIAIPPSSFSRQSSPGAFAIADRRQAQASASISTSKLDLQQRQLQTQQSKRSDPSVFPSSTSSAATSATFQNDVYAGYDISVNYGNLANDLTINNHASHSAEGSGGSGHNSGGGGPNDSYEARLSRLVGDLEHVDYGSFTNAADDIHASSAKYSSSNNGNHQDGEIDSSTNDIRVSTSLFKSSQFDGMDNGNYSNHPFAYASAGTPSHLDISNGPSSSSATDTASKPFLNNYLSNSLNFQNQFPLSSSPSNNGIINIEDALNSFSSSPYFNDFSAYTNLDDDLNTSGDIRIPPFETQIDNSQAPTPSSSISVPLTAAPSASSIDSGSSAAAMSEILLPPQSDKSHRRHQSESVNPTSQLPFSSLGSISLAAPLTIQQSKSMPFAPFQAHNNSDADDDDDFSKLLRDSQIDSNEPTAPFITLGNRPTTLSGFSTSSLPSDQSLATEAGGTFDLTMFPMPKSTATASVKMGSQPSSGSESSYGPSPSLSYGGSSTSNTSFDDPNASKDSAPFTPKKSKGIKNGKGNTKSLSISLEEAEPDTSTVTITPTHSPRPSISSMPPTPASYKTASSVPTSPYRPRPVIHASALAWRVAPSAHSPQSSIAVDTTRTIRPVASQSFINSDPFASPTSPSRLSKLSTASSPELKRRRNTVDDDDLNSLSGPQSIDATLSSLRDESLAAQRGNQTIAPAHGATTSPLRPIAYRRRVGHKFSNPQLQLPTSNIQSWQEAPALHQRQHSQPLPVTAQVPLQYNMPSNTAQNTQYYSQTNSQQLHTRQNTAPLPSPSSAALHYTQQQQQHQQHQPQLHQHPQLQQFQRQEQSTQASTGNGSWLSDNIISSLITQLSDQTYMCLMQNCSQRFASMNDMKMHVSGHFAPQAVPLQQSSQQSYQQQPPQQQQQQAFAQYPMYNQGNQYPQSQQQTWI